MQGFHEKQSSNNVAREAYLEFKFSDGVMVDCSDMDRSLNSSSFFSDDLSVISAAVGQKTEGGTGDCNVNWNSRPEESCQERMPKDIALPERKQSIPKDIAFQKRKPCMSSLGIYMCDCEEDSIYCNLVTCMASPLDEKISKVEGPSQNKVVASHEAIIKDNDCSNSGSTSRQKQGNAHYVRTLTWSSSSKGDWHNERACGGNFGNKSPIAAWAAVVSDSPCSLIPNTGLTETVSPKKCSRSVSCKERVPTFASHLELTENALIQGKLCSDYGEDVGNILALQNAPWHASSAICSTLNSQFAGLKLDVGNLSIREPVPYGTLHGVLHCTLKDGLPNYTFLLDDYEKVLTAKIWFEDIRQGEHQEIWKYSFYSLREEKKRKGKSGWKNWRRKDKLSATLVGKMKVSSVLCSEETHKLSVKSECILVSSRLNDSAATVEGSNSSTQALSGNGETHNCNDPNCNVYSLPGYISFYNELIG